MWSREQLKSAVSFGFLLRFLKKERIPNVENAGWEPLLVVWEVSTKMQVTLQESSMVRQVAYFPASAG